MGRRVTICVEVELIDGSPALFHVGHYGGWDDLYLYRDERDRLRVVTPREDLPTPVPEQWHGDWPPLASIIDAAFPETRRAAA